MISNSHMRKKGGYTSRALDMGVQWDFRDNCGHKKPKPPVHAIRYERPEFSPSFEHLCTERNHSYLIGEFGSVCEHCGHYVPHGEKCEARSEPPVSVPVEVVGKHPNCTRNPTALEIDKVRCFLKIAHPDCRTERGIVWAARLGTRIVRLALKQLIEAGEVSDMRTKDQTFYFAITKHYETL